MAILSAAPILHLIGLRSAVNRRPEARLLFFNRHLGIAQIGARRNRRVRERNERRSGTSPHIHRLSRRSLANPCSPCLRPGIPLHCVAPAPRRLCAASESHSLPFRSSLCPRSLVVAGRAPGLFTMQDHSAMSASRSHSLRTSALPRLGQYTRTFCQSSRRQRFCTPDSVCEELASAESHNDSTFGGWTTSEKY